MSDPTFSDIDFKNKMAQGLNYPQIVGYWGSKIRLKTMKAMARENSASFSLNMTENVENTLSAFGEFFV